MPLSYEMGEGEERVLVKKDLAMIFFPLQGRLGKGSIILKQQEFITEGRGS